MVSLEQVLKARLAVLKQGHFMSETYEDMSLWDVDTTRQYTCVGCRLPVIVNDTGTTAGPCVHKPCEASMPIEGLKQRALELGSHLGHRFDKWEPTHEHETIWEAHCLGCREPLSIYEGKGVGRFISGRAAHFKCKHTFAPNAEIVPDALRLRKLTEEIELARLRGESWRMRRK